MGSRGFDPNEEPRHQVRITQGFWFGETPVTQEQFRLWSPEHKNTLNAAGCPADNVKWRLSAVFCRWITQFLGLGDFPVWKATLPTEAQWEYGCRAGTWSEYYTGDGEAALSEAGWFRGNSENQARLVRKLKPNVWNLYDMHGSVYEWCVDRWNEQVYREQVERIEDPGAGEQREILINGPLSDMDTAFCPRSVRGGSRYSPREDCRSAGRLGRNPDDSGDVGFRVCLIRVPEACPNQAT